MDHYRSLPILINVQLGFDRLIYELKALYFECFNVV
jgi:hypothetical protein